MKILIYFSSTKNHNQLASSNLRKIDEKTARFFHLFSPGGRAFPRAALATSKIRPTILCMSKHLGLFTALLLLTIASAPAGEAQWRTIPLVKNGKLNPDWVQVGFGGWAVEGDSIRTDPAPEGLGLLVYKKEKLGNCQLRVVFKPKQIDSNSGVYIRIDDGILQHVGKRYAAFDRDASGKPSAESQKKVEASGDNDEGPWYAVHHGYEVQIAGGGDPLHGTGSLYSLADSAAAKSAKAGEWNTLLITLDGSKVSIDLNGEHASTFDSNTKNLPPRKIWHEPKREPKRPETGYIGLQTHDPKDIVWFKEISVRPLK
jgi:hypothetical protein